MRSVRSRLATLERLALDTLFSSPQGLYICRACSRRFPAALGTTAPYSTTAVRRDKDVGLPVQRRETTTWEGLKWVGSQEWIDNFMKPRRPLKPFIPTSIDRNPDALKDHVLKSLVEALVTTELGKPMSFKPPSKVEWPRGVQISVEHSDSNPSISFSKNGDREKLIEQLGYLSAKENVTEIESVKEEGSAPGLQDEESGVHTEAIVSSSSSEDLSGLKAPEQELILERDITEASEHRAAKGTNAAKESFPIEVVGSEWVRISLGDPAMKFKVVKRVMQRTGVKLPDSFIQQCDSVGSLFQKLLEKPKPNKLITSIQANPTMATLQNVQFHRRRITAVTKDKAVGRWKVIQQELTKRGLPVSNITSVNKGSKHMRFKSVRYKRHYDIHRLDQ